MDRAVEGQVARRSRPRQAARPGLHRVRADHPPGGRSGEAGPPPRAGASAPAVVSEPGMWLQRSTSAPFRWPGTYRLDGWSSSRGVPVGFSPDNVTNLRPTASPDGYDCPGRACAIIISATRRPTNSMAARLSWPRSPPPRVGWLEEGTYHRRSPPAVRAARLAAPPQQPWREDTPPAEWDLPPAPATPARSRIPYHLANARPSVRHDRGLGAADDAGSSHPPASLDPPPGGRLSVGGGGDRVPPMMPCPRAAPRIAVVPSASQPIPETLAFLSVLAIGVFFETATYLIGGSYDLAPSRGWTPPTSLPASPAGDEHARRPVRPDVAPMP